MLLYTAIRLYVDPFAGRPRRVGGIDLLLPLIFTRPIRRIIGAGRVRQTATAAAVVFLRIRAEGERCFLDNLCGKARPSMDVMGTIAFAFAAGVAR